MEIILIVSGILFLAGICVGCGGRVGCRIKPTPTKEERRNRPPPPVGYRRSK